MSDAKRVFQRQLQRLQLEEQAATSDYNAHLYNHDDDAAAEAMMQVAQARQQRETLVQQWNAEIERNTYRQPYVSEEARAARRPEEMDQEDMARIMNTSRYSGKSFTSADYDRLRRGLSSYKTSRGQEGR
jgi:DNA-binding transcriptional regulator YiaG